MKTDTYTSKMNGTTVFVKGYSANVRIHVETSNAPVPPVTSANYSEPQSLKSLVMNSWKENYSPGRVIDKLIKPLEVIATNGTFNMFSCTVTNAV